MARVFPYLVSQSAIDNQILQIRLQQRIRMLLHVYLDDCVVRQFTEPSGIRDNRRNSRGHDPAQAARGFADDPFAQIYRDVSCGDVSLKISELDVAGNLDSIFQAMLSHQRSDIEILVRFANQHISKIMFRAQRR